MYLVVVVLAMGIVRIRRAPRRETDDLRNTSTQKLPYLLKLTYTSLYLPSSLTEFRVLLLLYISPPFESTT